MQSAHNRKDILELPVNTEGDDFITADLHGTLGCLRAALQVLEAQPGNRLFIAGDMVDRGYHSVEVIKILAEYNVTNPGKINALRGNHEDLTLNSIAALEMLLLKYVQFYPTTDPMADEEFNLYQLIDDCLIEQENDGYTPEQVTMVAGLRSHLEANNGGEWVLELFVKDLAIGKINIDLNSNRITYANSSEVKTVVDYFNQLPYIISVRGDDKVMPNYIVHADIPICDAELAVRIESSRGLSPEERAHATWARRNEYADNTQRSKHSIIAYCGHNIIVNDDVENPVRESSRTVNLDVAAYRLHTLLMVNHTKCTPVLVTSTDFQGASKALYSNIEVEILNKNNKAAFERLFAHKKTIQDYLNFQYILYLNSVTQSQIEAVLKDFVALPSEIEQDALLAGLAKQISNFLNQINQKIDDYNNTVRNLLSDDVTGLLFPRYELKKLLQIVLSHFKAKGSDEVRESQLIAFVNACIATEENNKLAEIYVEQEISTIGQELIALVGTINHIIKQFNQTFPQCALALVSRAKYVDAALCNHPQLDANGKLHLRAYSDLSLRIFTICSSLFAGVPHHTQSVNIAKFSAAVDQINTLIEECFARFPEADLGFGVFSYDQFEYAAEFAATDSACDLATGNMLTEQMKALARLAQIFARHKRDVAVVSDEMQIVKLRADCCAMFNMVVDSFNLNYHKNPELWLTQITVGDLMLAVPGAALAPPSVSVTATESATTTATTTTTAATDQNLCVSQLSMFAASANDAMANLANRNDRSWVDSRAVSMVRNRRASV